MYQAAVTAAAASTYPSQMFKSLCRTQWLQYISSYTYIIAKIISVKRSTISRFTASIFAKQLPFCLIAFIPFMDPKNLPLAAKASSCISQQRTPIRFSVDKL